MTDPSVTVRSTPGLAPDPLLATSELLRRAKQGDAGALEALTARYLPRLQRWASGRLPMYARSLCDTNDLVQETLMRVVEGLDGIQVRGPGGFQAYVRSAVLNRIRDHIRWASRRPGPDGVPETIEAAGPSPLDLAIGADLVARYERALGTLAEEDQQLLHLRLELDYDLGEIATMTERPSRDAARMAVTRALRRLSETMGHDA